VVFVRNFRIKICAKSFWPKWIFMKSIPGGKDVEDHEDCLRGRVVVVDEDGVDDDEAADADADDKGARDGVSGAML
jgi:hypothetical protein